MFNSITSYIRPESNDYGDILDQCEKFIGKGKNDASFDHNELVAFRTALRDIFDRIQAPTLKLGSYQLKGFKILKKDLNSVQERVENLFNELVDIDFRYLIQLGEELDRIGRSADLNASQLDKVDGIRKEILAAYEVSNSFLVNSKNRERIPSVIAYAAKAGTLVEKMRVLLHNEQPLILKRTYSINQNAFFESKTHYIVKREPLSAGANCITEKLLLSRPGKKGILESGIEGTYICKTSPVLIFFPISLTSEKAEKSGIICKANKITTKSKLKLFEYFCQGGLNKDYPLSQEQLDSIRQEVFGFSHGGHRLLNDQALQELARLKKDNIFIEGLNSNMNPLLRKKMKPAFSAYDWFMRELKVAERLFGNGEKNPYVVETICGGTDPKEGAYIIQEFAHGRALGDYLLGKDSGQKALSEESIFNIGQQLLNGLFFMHSKNVVHNDIKEDNIQISEDFNVKILDLGEACMLDQPENNQFTGVSLTNAPELMILEGELRRKSISPSSDCYMAGRLLLRMLYTSSEDHEYFEQSFSHLSIYCDLIRRKLADGKIYKADPKIIVKWEKKLYKDIQALVEKKMKAYSQEQKAELIQVVFGLLRYNPKVRLTAEQSLFFLNKIAAEDISKRLTKEASS